MQAPAKDKVKEYLECNSFCPWCGEDDIVVDSQFDSETTIAWRTVECRKCGAEWYGEFRLAAISWMADDGFNREYSDEPEGGDEGGTEAEDV